MKPARAAAFVTWVYAAGFGGTALPVAVYLLTRGELPTFFGLFPMYGGPWSMRFKPGAFAALLVAFSGLTGLASWSAREVSQGRKTGAIVNLAVLPVEMVFWLGFALPFPWLAGAARAVLLATAWKSLAESHGSGARSEATMRPPLAVPDLA
jgi:hypothetical protein